MNGIEILLEINLLVFFVSFTYVITHMMRGIFNFRYGISKFETIISRVITKIKIYNSPYPKDRAIKDSVGVLLIILIFISVFVLYFYNFYVFVINNYVEELPDIFRLSITPILFLILPLFIPSIIEVYQYGFHPTIMKERLEKYREHFLKELTEEEYKNKLKSTTDKKKILTNKGFLLFYFIWVVAIIILITIFISLGENNPYYFFTGNWITILIYFITLILLFLIVLLIRNVKQPKKKKKIIEVE